MPNALKTLEEKREIIRQFNQMRSQGVKVKNASRKLGLATDTDIYRLLAQVEKADSRIEPVREIRKVDHDNGKILKAENIRLKMIVAELMLDLSTLAELMLDLSTFKEYAGR